MENTTEKLKIVPGGLLPKPENKKPYSLTTVFGAPKIEDLPTGEFFVGEPMEIKNQDINYPSDFCASYGASEVSEDQEMVSLVPEWTFAQAKRLIIEDNELTDENEIQNVIHAWGLNLDDICRAAVHYGFLERDYDPFHCETEQRPERNFLADYRNWPVDLEMLGSEHRKNSFFECDGPYDTFDKLRAAMYLNRKERRSILTGAFWRRSWQDAKDGIIEDRDYSNERGGGHAFKIFGQLIINGEIHLICQLSNGDKVGDKGLYYFPRGVVNKEFTFGAYTFKDMPAGIAKYHSENGLRIDDSPIAKLFKVLWLFLLSMLGIKK